ncbi:nuclear transport factor 2 family protein, partial [Limnohabitans sp.]|uniref:YybH family protein n=1 Tax=Limnohabitans sp. TaxID=1907725 RepID=UPI0025BAD12F
ASPSASASAARAAPVPPAKPSPSVAAAPPVATPPAALAAASAAAPAATTTPPPAARPAADARTADRAAINQAVQDWAKAWGDQDMARYFAAYANNFTPANRASRAQWESDRRIRIVSKKSISVQVREIQISFNGDTASARFQQLYTSDNLKNTSRKTLELVRQGNRWLIARESVN